MAAAKRVSLNLLAGECATRFFPADKAAMIEILLCKVTLIVEHLSGRSPARWPRGDSSFAEFALNGVLMKNRAVVDTRFHMLRPAELHVAFPRIAGI